MVCDFGVNCTWSMGAICMLITVWPFAFPLYSLRCVQMRAGKVTHILLWHITRGIAQDQSVQSIFPAAWQTQTRRQPQPRWLVQSSLPSSPCPQEPGRWHSSSSSSSTAPQLQDQRNRCWITPHFLELSSSKKFWILPGFSFPPVIHRGSRSLWKQDYAGPQHSLKPQCQQG